MGIAYSDKGDYGKAIECYEKAAESDADKAKIAYYNMGNAYEVKKDWDKAIECWEKTIALDPDFYINTTNQLALNANHSLNLKQNR